MEEVNIFKKYGLKVTKPREAIYAILKSAEEGMDAEKIKSLTDEKGYSINLSTVYRTLDLLTSLGIFEKFDLGEKKYNYRMRKNDHLHTVKCNVCGEEVHMDCPMTKIEEFIKKETGFTVLEHHLELKGICRKCSGEINSEEEGNS